ncbi:MAG: alpha/beta hydrolase [Saprospiraceae bacterium]|nr:alpha/beta hydrolase [Saprospiraceae bacterium]MBK6565393.1 alpha/beta hydrolase [Saprospiraceae bacterium]MBK7522662.1 alpha/beta hydrolase [Saprospiraceae bacterium]MBK8080026.1 alpha/beta hydrolase [Saprospiraceae bacterium]MBK8370842.1 alpha/beta hydrolase [Saprospiraceae bacterium]
MIKKLLVGFSALIVLYILGPKVEYEPVTLFETSLGKTGAELENYITEKEKRINDLKENNASKIYWYHDSLKQKTTYVVLYLHGFSASPEEGKDFVLEFGKKYGCNVYIPRLEDHGRNDTMSFVNLTPDNYLQSAEDAVDVAQNLGENIILISCSTGSTLGLILAANGEKIHAHFMYSPNIDIADKKSELLLYPWAKQLSRIVKKGDFNRVDYTEEQKKYWNHIYHMNGAFVVKNLINDYMKKEWFQKINHPVFVAYYYKNEAMQDDVVSVQRIKKMFEELGTVSDLKKEIAFSDVMTHMIISPLFSKQYEEIKSKSYEYAETVLSLKPMQDIKM